MAMKFFINIIHPRAVYLRTELIDKFAFDNPY